MYKHYIRVVQRKFLQLFLHEKMNLPLKFCYQPFEQFAKTERNFRQKNVFTSKISLSIRCSAFRIS